MFRSPVAPFTESDNEGLVSAMRSAAALAHKDLRAALEGAGTLGVTLPMATLTEDRCDDLVGVGRGQGPRGAPPIRSPRRSSGWWPTPTTWISMPQSDRRDVPLARQTGRPTWLDGGRGSAHCRLPSLTRPMRFGP